MNQRDFAKTLRQNMTDAERLLWKHLRAHRYLGPKFRRQQPIGPYIVDFVHFRARLVVECDGGQHNESQHDLRRDAWLEAQGFTVLRFWNHDILNQTESMLSAIYAFLNPLSPNPSPARGEGDSGASIRRKRANQTNEPLPSQESNTPSDASLSTQEN
ncbi:MAG: endonuclease domain-containing protein, partial [Candidatus Thiodiazotropha sp.]